MDQSASLSMFTGIPSQAVWAGIAVAVGVGIFLARKFSWSNGDDEPVLLLGPATARARENSEFWEVLPTKADDRRHVPRLEGNPTPIQVIGPDGRQRQSACVLDRNSGGVRLSSEKPAAIGTELLLLADASPPGTPWVKVSVCWCKSEGRDHQIGCRFAEPIPWNILLLFG